MKMSQAMVVLANKEVGVEEIDGTNCGPRVNQYKAATNLPADEEWPWCAAFVCFITREAMNACGIKETAGFKRPTTAGAWAFEQWSLRQDNTTQTRRLHHGDIEAGDIVVFTFSHIGIATGPPVDGRVPTIEGNTDGQGSREGGAVLRKSRRVEQIKCRIRFTV